MAEPVARFTDAVEEHLATRRACGLFDFSFMGQFAIAGPDARRFLERLQTRNPASLAPGKVVYTLLLREDGTVFVDATVWCLAPDRFWLFTGRRSDVAFVAETVRQRSIDLRDRSGEYAVLAVQGPQSARVLERHLGAAPGVPYFGFRAATLADVPVTIGRLGYSGELGYELIVPSDVAPALWSRLAVDARECGFDAANSLRIESGYVLFSSELARPADPFELGLERLVSFDARRFTGADALRRRRWREPARRLVGLVPVGDAGRPPTGAGDLPRAEVTSRAFSPVFGRDLALGFVPARAAWPGELVTLGDSGRARVGRLPFYDPGRVRPRRG